MAEVPPQYIYTADDKKRQLKKPDDDFTYIGRDDNKKKDSLFYWHLDEAETAKSRLPVWIRAKDRRINPAFKAYNKARTNAINANLAAMTTKTLGQVNMSGEPRGNYAAALLGKKKPGTNVNNVNELAGLMDKVTMGGKRSKKRSTKKRHTKKRSTRRHRKSSKKTMRRRR